MDRKSYKIWALLDTNNNRIKGVHIRTGYSELFGPSTNH